MPAGANGRLYGAVTGQTICDELAKLGFHIERKRIEIAGSGFKSVGKYKAAVKLYESQAAEIQITVAAQIVKTEAPHAPARPTRRRAASPVEATGSGEVPAAAEAPAVEAPAVAESVPENTSV
jgi:large subunit ribosomal protein L9